MTTQLQTWTSQIALLAEPVSILKARSFVLLHLVEHGLARLVDDVQGVVCELAANAVVGTNTTFEVRLTAADGMLVLAVRDRSPEFPIASTSAPVWPNVEGLQLVEELCDDWGIHPAGSGHKSVWASFRL